MYVFPQTKILPHINLSLNDVIIKIVPKFNYLGIVIDEHLSWNSHNEMIGLKVSKAIGIINHLKSTYPQRVLFTHYNSLIILMLYGILLWGKSDNVDKIVKLQKRAIRTISFSRPIAHTRIMYLCLLDLLNVLNHCSKHSIF